MTYSYFLTCFKGERDRVRVEAWPRSKELALPQESRRPSFIIGQVAGPRTVMLTSFIDELKRHYETIRNGSRLKIRFPDQTQAIADAYRAGLTCMVLSRAESSEQAQGALTYVMGATKEEVWFWASKFLGVVDEALEAEKVVEALCLISGAKDPSLRTPFRKTRAVRKEKAWSDLIQMANENIRKLADTSIKAISSISQEIRHSPKSRFYSFYAINSNRSSVRFAVLIPSKSSITAVLRLPQDLAETNGLRQTKGFFYPTGEEQRMTIRTEVDVKQLNKLSEKALHYSLSK